MQAVLDDWRNAPIREPLRRMLAFLEKLTLDPASVTAGDIRPLRDAGLSDDAIEDAIHACAVFNVFDRMADALDFDIPDRAASAWGAAVLLKRGYL